MSRKTIRLYEAHRKLNTIMNSYDLKSAQEANARRMADDEAPAQYRGATPFPKNTFADGDKQVSAVPLHRDCIRPPAPESAAEQYAKGLEGSYVYAGRQQAPSPDYSSPDVIHVEEGEQLGHWRQKCIEMGAELEKVRIAVKCLQEQATDLATRLGKEHSENEHHRATMQAIRDLMHWHRASNSAGEFAAPALRFGVFFKGVGDRRGYCSCSADFETRALAQKAIDERVLGGSARADTYEVRPLS